MKNFAINLTDNRKRNAANPGGDQKSSATTSVRSKIDERRFIRKNLLPELERYLSRSGRSSAFTSKGAREL